MENSFHENSSAYCPVAADSNQESLKEIGDFKVGQSFIISNNIGLRKDQQMTLRLLLQAKEIGSIIGKGGAHIKYIRDQNHDYYHLKTGKFLRYNNKIALSSQDPPFSQTNARISITDGSTSERVVNIMGQPDETQRAFGMICKQFDKDLNGEGSPGARDNIKKAPITLKAVVPATQCGLLIGRGGCKIKEIREKTGASMHISSELLPYSTERAVTISGTASALTHCIGIIIDILNESAPKGPQVLYHPRPNNYASNPISPPARIHSVPFAPNTDSIGNVTSLNIGSQPAVSVNVTPSTLLSFQSLSSYNFVSPVLSTPLVQPSILGSLPADPLSSPALGLPVLPPISGDITKTSSSVIIAENATPLVPLNAENIPNQTFNSTSLPLQSIEIFNSNLQLLPLSSTLSNSELSQQNSNLLNHIYIQSVPMLSLPSEVQNFVSSIPPVKSNSSFHSPKINTSVENLISSHTNITTNINTPAIDTFSSEPPTKRQVIVPESNTLVADQDIVSQSFASHQVGYQPALLNDDSSLLTYPSYPSTIHPQVTLKNVSYNDPVNAFVADASGMITQFPGSDINVTEISIPNDLIGCIIGRGGSKINEIRQISGANIKISNLEEECQERKVAICGSIEGINQALCLINTR